MAHELPNLPYAKDALAPHISAETLDFHHGKHHAAYVKKLNAAVEGTKFANLPIEELIRDHLGEVPQDKKGAVFNNGCQHFNHSFYWKCMSPNDTSPSAGLQRAIDAYGGLEKLKTDFLNEAGTHFASGWAWIVKQGNGIAVVSTHDADTPLAHGQEPILTADVWEHAYYIDYRNARPDYLGAFWKIVNWDFASQNFEG